MDRYQTEDEIEAVVQGFESCTTAKEDFKHGSHLTVAVWYLLHATPDEALQKMRAGLLRFLEHHGVGREKYHETLTVFWIHLVRSVMDEAGDPANPLETTNMILERLADHRVVFEFYSEAVVSSDEARRSWIRPNLKGLACVGLLQG